MPYSVIVLCAGIGERLRPLTYTTNKSLLDINGKALIQHFIEALQGLDVDTVHIVIGHYGYLFRKLLGSSYSGIKIQFHENPLFKVTGAAQSLYTVSDVLRRGPCIVLEGDHYLDPRLMARLMSSSEKNCVLVDEDLSRLKYDEEVVAYGYRGLLEYLQWPAPYPARPIGEALTIFKLDETASKGLAWGLEHYLLENGPAKREIVEPINRLMGVQDIHYALTIGLKWVEVDYPEDLEVARNLKW